MGTKRERTDPVDRDRHFLLLKEELSRIREESGRREDVQIAEVKALNRQREKDEIAAAYQQYDERCKGFL